MIFAMINALKEHIAKKDNIYHCQKEIYDCFDDYPFLIIKDYTCSEECNSKDFFENICIKFQQFIIFCVMVSIKVNSY